MKKKPTPTSKSRSSKPGRPMRRECDEDDDLLDEDRLKDENEDPEEDDQEGDDEGFDDDRDDAGDDEGDEDSEDLEEDEPARRTARASRSSATSGSDHPVRKVRKNYDDEDEDDENEDIDDDALDEDLNEGENPDDDKDDEDSEDQEDDEEPLRPRTHAGRSSRRRRSEPDVKHAEKSRAGKKAKKAAVDLFPDLQPGGIAEKNLQRNAKTARKQKHGAHLLKTLEHDLRCMRNHDQLPSVSSGLSQSDKLEAYGKVLHTIKYDGDREDRRYRVFRYCLAHHAALEVEEKLWDDALTSYVAHRRAFDLVLGDFLPADFRDHAAEIAFANNLNPTALGDWTYYQEHMLPAQQLEVGLQTGLTSLDEACGGLRSTNLLAGPTGSGKTSLGLELALGALQKNDDLAVLFFTLEMPRHRVFNKLRSREAGIDFRTLVSGQLSAEQRKALAAAETRLKDVLRRMSFVERLAGLHRKWHQEQEVLSVMKAHFIKLVRAAGVRHCLVIVDSLQRLPVEDPIVGYTEKDQPQQRALSELEAEEERLRTLLEFQRWTCSPDLPDGSPILAISRVTKGVQGRRLVLDDVPGRAGQVHDVDAVFLIEPDVQAVTNSRAVTPTIVNVAKVRDGGLRGDLRLDFHFTISRFQEAAGSIRPGTAAGSTATSVGTPTKKRSAGKSLE